MRRSCKQQRLDCQGAAFKLNLNCRDEIIPILAALQHVYAQPQLRDEILRLVKQDVNATSRADCGREGMSYWQIVVLAAVRLGCNLNYDKLQDLAEQHRALRQVMGVGDWECETFDWRRICDNLCKLKPETIEKISHLIVGEGHRLDPQAPKQVRADSFVSETNIHYPSESTLIRDGIRKIIELCLLIVTALQLPGWRQHGHLLKTIKNLVRNIERIAARKGPNYEQRLKPCYKKLLRLSGKLIGRANRLLEQVEALAVEDPVVLAQVSQLRTFIERTQHVRGTATRRVIHGETVPNSEKLFSIFEPHTQLYKRGKAGEPVQFGRLAMIYEDAAGFIVHHHVLPRDAHDRDVVVEQTRLLQQRLGGRIESASFDRGFHSPENQSELAKIVNSPCLMMSGAKQAETQKATASVAFHSAQQRHSGIESAIGGLQSGNGLKRCRDRSELGFERYVALAVLGRNLHVLGKLLIARQQPQCKAAYSERKPAA